MSPHQQTPKILAVFPGQGSIAPEMSQTFDRAFKRFRETFDEAEDWLGFPLQNPRPPTALSPVTLHSLMTVATSIALWRVALEEFDIHPAAVAGISLGELTAAIAAGFMSFPDGLKLVQSRSECMAAFGRKGRMIAVLGVTHDKITEEIHTLNQPRDLAYACLYSPKEHVVSGTPDLIDRLIAQLSHSSCRVIALPIDVASHSPLMEPVLPCYAKNLISAPWRSPHLPLINGFDGEWRLTGGQVMQDLLLQLVRPVFWPKVIQQALDTGFTTTLELSTKPIVTRIIERMRSSLCALHFTQFMTERSPS